MLTKRKFMGVLATVIVVLGAGSACTDPVEIQWDWDGDTQDYPRYGNWWGTPDPGAAGDLHIEGAVYVDSTSQTIPDAIVVATQVTSSWTDSTVTDSVGRFRLVVPPAPGSTSVRCEYVNLEVHADGYQSAPQRSLLAYASEACPGDGNVEAAIHLSPDR